MTTFLMKNVQMYREENIASLLAYIVLFIFMQLHFTDNATCFVHTMPKHLDEMSKVQKQTQMVFKYRANIQMESRRQSVWMANIKSFIHMSWHHTDTVYINHIFIWKMELWNQLQVKEKEDKCTEKKQSEYEINI